MLFKDKKCDFKGCKYEARYDLVMVYGPKVIEYKLCPRCACKVVRLIKGLPLEREEE